MLARENLQKSDWPDRFSMLAICLLLKGFAAKSGDENYYCNLLNAGCSQGDSISKYLWSLFLLTRKKRKESRQKEAIRLLKEAAAEGLPEAAYHLWKSNGGNTQEAQFWELCQLGSSRICGGTELLCSVKLVPAPYSCRWNVCEIGPFQREQIQGFSPYLRLTNRNSFTFTDLQVRICCPDIQLEKTINLTSPLRPGKYLRIVPEDYDIVLGEQLYVEVRSGKYRSEMEFLPSLGQTTLQHSPHLSHYTGNVDLGMV